MHGSELGRRRVRTRDGFRMDLDLSDWVDQYIFVTGLYEESTSALVRALLAPGNTFIDVGANIGYFALKDIGIC